MDCKIKEDKHAISENSLGKSYTRKSGRVMTLGNKEMLMKKIMSLSEEGELDWCEIEQSTGEPRRMYLVQKIIWNESIVLLIGDCGDHVVSCFLPGDVYGLYAEDEKNIRKIVEQFWILEEMENDAYIAFFS